jgi:hypothetical protein
MIHTFGDSHSYSGWGGIKDIQIHHLGPKLCFSVGRDGIDIKEGYNVENGDTVIFCFGEIDCRCHVHKHVTEHNDFKQIIDNIVNNYFIQIQTAVNKFDKLNTVIYNVVPPVQKNNTGENSDYPYLGTDDERKSYTLYFNEKLKEKCIKYNFLFFDIYNHYVDSNGFLNKSLSDGNVHIRDGTYLNKFVENNLFVINKIKPHQTKEYKLSFLGKK